MEKSPRLFLNYVSPQQAQRHVSVNEAFRILDVVVQSGVLSASLAVEPLTPNEGDSYILPHEKFGPVWSEMGDYSLATYQDGVWRELRPRQGWRAFVADQAQLFVFDGAAWVRHWRRTRNR